MCTKFCFPDTDLRFFYLNIKREFLIFNFVVTAHKYDISNSSMSTNEQREADMLIYYLKIKYLSHFQQENILRPNFFS